jgi:uncharacterized protein YneF (UPF0154 family)
MEIGGFFLLIVLLVVVGAVGGGIYAIAARGRQKQLATNATSEGEQSRPEHLEVDSEQQVRFVDGQ